MVLSATKIVIEFNMLGLSNLRIRCTRWLNKNSTIIPYCFFPFTKALTHIIWQVIRYFACFTFCFEDKNLLKMKTQFIVISKLNIWFYVGKSCGKNFVSCSLFKSAHCCCFQIELRTMRNGNFQTKKKPVR